MFRAALFSLAPIAACVAMAGCAGDDSAPLPGEASAGEASALRDASAMLAERRPAPTVPSRSPPASGAVPHSGKAELR